MNVLFVGDVFGSPGREFLKLHLPDIVASYNIDLVVVNGENAAGGQGLTPAVAQELFDAGVDVFTSGNHIWDKREIYPLLDTERRILRPANYPPGVPGKGSGVFQTKKGEPLAIINIAGRVFSPQELDCPFRALDTEIMKVKGHALAIMVDFHAEATSEKVAMGWYADGKVSAVLGTHTHIQTADECVLPDGTAYITDVGMTGSIEGVIGVKREIILKHFLTQLPVRHEPAKGKRQLCAVVFSVGTEGKASSIQRIRLLE